MSSIERRHFRWPWTTPNLVFKLTLFFNTEICEMVKDTARVNPLRLYMRTRPRNDFTSSYTTHPIHATGSRAKLSTKKSIKVKNKTVFLKHRVYIDNRHSLWWLVRNWLNPHWNDELTRKFRVSGHMEETATSHWCLVVGELCSVLILRRTVMLYFLSTACTADYLICAAANSFLPRDAYA